MEYKLTNKEMNTLDNVIQKLKTRIATWQTLASLKNDLRRMEKLKYSQKNSNKKK